jgi:hypothetical protein
MILSKDNAKVGLKIRNRNNPDWGTFTLKQDRNGWIYSADHGSAMLFFGELHFWEIVE